MFVSDDGARLVLLRPPAAGMPRPADVRAAFIAEPAACEKRGRKTPAACATDLDAEQSVLIKKKKRQTTFRN
jgi:hypothetical protein